MLRPCRAHVLCFLVAMALSINTRAFTQSAARPQDIARLAELRSVHDAFKWFQSHEADLRKMQVTMVKVPAPPFGEGTRAQWVRDRFKEAGLQEIEIDKAGNVTGISHGTDRRLP